MNMKKWLKEWGTSIVIAAVLYFTINTYVAQAVKVPTGSMLPTIQLQDRLVVEKMLYFTNFKFGDIVVFYPPINQPVKDKYVKRLIGLPGDTIQVKNGSLFRNGEKVSEPYVKEPMKYEFGPVVVPDNKYLFLGDNRNDSFDSHLWPTPFVDKGDIIGKIIFRFYPFNEIGVLK